MKAVERIEVFAMVESMKWVVVSSATVLACGMAFAAQLPKVRGNVVLSDRDSATFFELRRDGQVLLHDHWLKELDGATNFEHRLVSVNAKDRSWRWRDGYLPILEIGGDVELFAKGDGLFIRRADEFTVWPDGRKVDEAEFLSARASIIEYWRKWFAAGLQLPYQDKRVENACKASLVQGLCMFAGRHPVYGAGNYRTFIHDSFHPATLAMCETLIQFGHPEEAADVLVYYLDRFLLADGEIDYYGPSLAEYGGFMWVSSMVMDAEPARAAEVAVKVRPLVKAVLRRFNYQGPGGRVGPHKLLSGSPEADMKDAKDEYYHNNCQVLLGLRMIATRYHDVGDVFFANDIRKYARMLERMIGAAYSAKRAALGGVPYSEGQMRFYDDIQTEMNSTYANYRYYPELLESGWLSAEDAEWVVKYRESHNGDYHGMTLFSPPGWGSRTDNWPIASYARGLLEYGMHDRFEKVLRGMLDHYLSDDTFTAYEQVYTNGDPRTPAAPACVPAQLAFPRMLAWSFKYTPWKMLIRRGRLASPGKVRNLQ